MSEGDGEGMSEGLGEGSAEGMSEGDGEGMLDGLGVCPGHRPQLSGQFAAASGYALHLHGYSVVPGLLFTQSHRRISFPPVPGTRNRPGLSWHTDGAGDTLGAAVFPLLPLLMAESFVKTYPTKED